MHHRFAFAACLLAFSAGAARAGDLVVLNGKDDVANPPAGSLRSLLLVAQPNDVIHVRAFVALRGPLTVTQTGLRIVGDTGPGDAILGPAVKGLAPDLVIDALNVRIERLGFLDVRILAQDARTGLSVHGCAFDGAYEHISAIRLGARNSGVTIGSVAAPNVFRCGGAAAISADDADDLHVAGNRFEKSVVVALEQQGGERLVFADNRLKSGSVHLGIGSGEIRDNRTASDADFVVLGVGAAGSLVVADNAMKFTGLGPAVFIEGFQDVHVLRNVIRCGAQASGISWETLEGDSVSSATVEIADNDVDGGTIGVEVASAESDTVQVSEGLVSRQEFAGVVVSMGAGGSASVTDVTCDRVGRDVRSDGIRVRTAGAAVLVRDCLAVRGRGQGFAARTGPGRITFAACTAAGNGGDGYLADAGTFVSLENGAVAGSKGSGLFAAPGAHLAMAGTRFGKNKGPDIDLADRGESANTATKTANDDLDFPVSSFDAQANLAGTTIPFGAVVLYAPDGDGLLAQAATVTADASGAFQIPAANLPREAFRLLVRDPADGDVSEMTGPLKKPKPVHDGGGGGGDEVIIGMPEPGPGGVTADLTVPPGPYVAGATITLRFAIQNPNDTPVGPFDYVFTKTAQSGTKDIGTFHGVTLIPRQNGGGFEMLTQVPVILQKGANTIACRFGGKILGIVTITAK